MANITRQIWRYAPLGAAFAVLALGTAGMLLARETLVPAPDQTQAQVQAEASMPVSAQASMEEFLVERALMREMQMEQLQAIVDDERTQEDVRASAQRRMLELLDWMEQETTIEGVLRARGFAQAVATVHEDSANVLVETSALSQEDANAILELVTRETGLLGGNIKIIPLNSP